MRQPYQEASDEIVRQSSAPGKAVKNIASIAGSAALGGAGLSTLYGRLSPFLSKYIPADLAVKGISKIDPKIGNFLKGAMAQGTDIEGAMEFIKNKFDPKDPDLDFPDNTTSSQQAIPNPEEPSQRSKHYGPLEPIAQYSPELADFILERIDKGQSPGMISTMAKEKFSKIVGMLEKDNQNSLENLLNSLIGGKGAAPEQKQGNMNEALMASLQKIMSM